MRLGKVRHESKDLAIRHFYAEKNWSIEWMCGQLEIFWGIIKIEMYQMYEITDEVSLRYAIKDYLRFYSEERPQDRYHCRTPLEVWQASPTLNFRYFLFQQQEKML